MKDEDDVNGCRVGEGRSKRAASPSTILFISWSFLMCVLAPKFVRYLRFSASLLSLCPGSSTKQPRTAPGPRAPAPRALAGARAQFEPRASPRLCRGCPAATPRGCSQEEGCIAAARCKARKSAPFGTWSLRRMGGLMRMHVGARGVCPRRLFEEQPHLFCSVSPLPF